MHGWTQVLEELPQADWLEVLFRRHGLVVVHHCQVSVSFRLAGCYQLYGASAMQLY